MPKEEEKPKDVDVEDELLNSYGLDDDQKKAAKVHAAARDLYAHRQRVRDEAKENDKKGKESKSNKGWRSYGS